MSDDLHVEGDFRLENETEAPQVWQAWLGGVRVSPKIVVSAKGTFSVPTSFLPDGAVWHRENEERPEP